MSRRLLAVKVLLGVVACLLAAVLARELASARPLPPPPVPREAAVAVQQSASEPLGQEPLSAGGYGVIAAKNLFSPSRAEALSVPVVAAEPRPFLHGVVVDGSRSRAFLEDPAVRRTFGYAVGDTVGSGHVQSISVDRVVIARPDGQVEVLLNDPSKPGPAGQAPAAPPAPGTTRPATMTVPPPAMIPGADPVSPTLRR